jgi:hypothetical protein
MPTPSHTRLAVVVTAVLLAGLVALLVGWRRTGAPAAEPAAGAEGPPASVAPHVPRVAAPRARAGAAPPQEDQRSRQASADWRRLNVYPPWSRPLTGTPAELVWNERFPLSQPLDESWGQGLHATLELDRHFAAPGTALTATVKVVKRSDEKEEAVPFVVRGEVQVHDQSHAGGDGPDRHWRAIQALDFERREGRAEARFVPSQNEALAARHSDARVVAFVTAGKTSGPSGQIAMPLRRDFAYAATEPVVMVRKDSDRRGLAWLEVTLTVDVKEVLNSSVEAWLFNADGTVPVASYRGFLRPTRTGPQPLVLRFYAKALRDRGIDGPYSVRAIRGVATRPAADPAELFWQAPAELAFVTGPYRAADFPATAWSDPAYHEQLRQFDDAITGSQVIE